MLLSTISGVEDLVKSKFATGATSFSQPDVNFAISGKIVAIVWEEMFIYMEYWINIYGL